MQHASAFADDLCRDWLRLLSDGSDVGIARTATMTLAKRYHHFEAADIRSCLDVASLAWIVHRPSSRIVRAATDLTRARPDLANVVTVDMDTDTLRIQLRDEAFGRDAPIADVHRNLMALTDGDDARILVRYIVADCCRADDVWYEGDRVVGGGAPAAAL